MKHTKGKWESVKKHKDEYDIWAGDSAVFIATTRSVPTAAHEPGIHSKQANANLIASAPEMLQLLKDILAEVRPEISIVNNNAGCTIFNPAATETIDMAKDLIAKAEGNIKTGILTLGRKITTKRIREELK